MTNEETERQELKSFITKNKAKLLERVVREIDKMIEGDGQPHSDTMELHEAIRLQENIKKALTDLKNKLTKDL